MNFLSLAKRVLNKATGRALMTKSDKYQVHESGRHGFTTIDSKREMTAEDAIEMAFIAISRPNDFREGVEIDFKTRQEGAFTAIAIDVLNRHFSNRPNLTILNDHEIVVNDEDIEEILNAYYSPNSLAIMRDIPPSFDSSNAGKTF